MYGAANSEMKRKIESPAVRSSSKRSRGRFFIETGAFLAILGGLLWPTGDAILSPLLRAVFDALHFPVFVIATVFVFRAIPGRNPAGTRAILALIWGFVLAAAVEMLQPAVGRQTSTEDLLRGCGGVVMGALGSFLFSGQYAMKGAYLVVVIAITGFEFVPAWRLLLATRWQGAQFPMLADLENPSELLLWTPQGGPSAQATVVEQSKAFASRGRHGLRVKTAPRGYAGVSYAPGGQDWSGFTELAWEIWNPAEAFTLGIRIDDDGDVTTAQDRFTSALRVERGNNAFRVALEDVKNGSQSRRMKLNAIKRIVFYTELDTASRVFFLDALRLE